MSKKKKLLIAIPSTVIALVLAALLFVGNYMVNFAILRSDEEKDVSPDSIVSAEDASVIEANRAMLDAESDLWHSTADIRKVSITSDDGLNLVAELITTDSNSHRWLLGVHGYNSCKEEYFNTACQYAKNGYNILLPDMRSHGESEGVYIGMGALERYDLLKWLDYIIEYDPRAEIIVQGTSMGGATVMLLAGEQLPGNVKGIVEDCGYTSVWDIFADELEYMFGLPTFPVLNASEFVAKIRAGYTFREASSVERVSKATVPMLFIHGSEDNFVRTDMVYDVYEACPTAKEMLIIEGAGHGESHRLDPQLYYTTVFNFIEENCF